ncbi:uncharacterized protein [Pagrus major]|uniref:uncharacterized protein n=1 Tax=Pagrus major TaxID=143350 RepID=UPI003CC8E019
MTGNGCSQQNILSGSTYYIHEYILVTHPKMSWTEAQSYCREQHGDLATISNVQVNSRIADMAKDWEEPFWIGLYEDIYSWKWSLMGEHYYTGVVEDYRQWQEDQPDNVGADEYCVSMMEDGFWRDNSCTFVKMPLICFADGSSDQYVLVTEQKSWFEAQSYCRQHHTDLVSVRSPAENQELRSRLQTNQAVQEAWIGLHRDSWTWSDGSSSLFRQWWPNQPSNENNSQTCATMHKGSWDNFKCDTEFSILCQNITEVTPAPPVEPTTIRQGCILLRLRITHQAANVALGGVTDQSSVWDPLIPSNVAIDGKSYSHYNYRSCFSTHFEVNPWWRLDLQVQYNISSIEVIRRSDCCAYELNGAEIRIGNSLENNGNNNPRCAVITVIGDVLMGFSCSQMTGRYVNIVVPGAGKRLQLCEVRVYTNTRITGANVALGGVTVQSSFWKPARPSNMVIDGKPYANYLHGSCISSLWESNPWWRLDMRGPYIISTIEVIRRSDSNFYDLNGAEIRIGNSLENNGNNNPRCAVITLTNDITMSFSCNKMTGRYVNIFHPGVKRILQFCEVKVYATTRITGVEVALRGKATQSAEPASSTTAPNMAIDRNPVNYFQETCASVPLQDNPWWRLDLRSIYRITAVSVVSDCCSKELNGAEVRIGLKNDTSNQRCAVISLAEGQHKYNYQCGIMDGRFVHVVLPGLQKNLTICDVRVYGTVLENVAVRGVAFQSSLRWKNSASRVIDGRWYSTCSITENKPGQWVTVDLLVPYTVTLVQLAYPKDSYYSDDVRVDNTSCQVISMTSQFLMTLDCGGVVGRYVTVMHPNVPPPLCEVKVYSTWVCPQNRVPQRPPRHDYCLPRSCSRDYIVIHSEPKTWFEAQAYCRNTYTDLATINNPQDMNRVIDKMENKFNDFWIGLYEDAVTWRWSLPDEGYYGDGEAEFRNWGVDEPNKMSGIQHCAGIQHTGEWKDLDCDLLHYFLCFDGRDGAPETKILVETQMKWTDAQHYCREHHTDLLSVKNLTENQEVQSMVPVGKLAWIGLFGESWRWSDGSNSLYKYQWQGLVDNLGEGPNCVYIYNRKWSVRSCDTKSMFLCYYFRKRSVVRIRADYNMSDPVIQQQILSQLEAAMKNKGISDFKISWRTSYTLGKNSRV